jgi:hypothetical protein
VILAVVDYVDGNGEPPPELVFYFHLRDFGDPWGQGWMRWPPGALMETLLVRNVYNAWQGYRMAENPVQWLNKHPAGAEVVGQVKALLLASEPESTRMERWETVAGNMLARQQWQRVTGR